jgi:hypothetical protein
VAADVDEARWVALACPGAEMPGADGWEAHGGVAKCGTSGGHADGACEGDEERSAGRFGVVAKAGATESYRVVG